MGLHRNIADEKDGPDNFLQFGQAGWIVNTNKYKKNLEPRAHPAHYPRCGRKSNYRVYRPDTKNITTIRTNEFVLESTAKENEDAKQKHTDEKPKLSTISLPTTPETETPARTIEELPGPSALYRKQPLSTPQPKSAAIKVGRPHEAHIATAFTPMTTIRKWAVGNSQNNPDITGGNIEKEIKKERCVNMAMACASALIETATIDDKTQPPPAPKTLEEALNRQGTLHRAKAWDNEITRHDAGLNTWTYEDELPTDRPIPYVMTFKAKPNMYGGLHRYKVRCAIRGDRMRPGIDFDETRTASYMPSQAGRRLLMAACVAEGHFL